jgi:hypothetical protein
MPHGEIPNQRRKKTIRPNVKITGKRSRTVGYDIMYDHVDFFFTLREILVDLTAIT